MTAVPTFLEYLGDGVYASFDGYHIVLELRGQEPTWPITRIALEPPVLVALDRYRARINEYLKTVQEQP